MALGGNNTNESNNNQRMNTPTYYSRLRFRNEEEKTSLDISFWNGTLKLTINPIVPFNPTQGRPQDSKDFIHLSPTKCAILGGYVDTIMNNESIHDMYGVNSGMTENQSLIVISRNDNNVPYIIISKIDPNGKVISSKQFTFNSEDYHYGLQVDFNGSNAISFDKLNGFKNLELGQFRDLLFDYARYMNGAAAFSYWDLGRYESSKSNNLINRIADKLGIEKPSRGSVGSSSNSYFNKQKNDSEFMNRPTAVPSSTPNDIDDIFNE